MELKIHTLYSCGSYISELNLFAAWLLAQCQSNCKASVSSWEKAQSRCSYCGVSIPVNDLSVGPRATGRWRDTPMSKQTSTTMPGAGLTHLPSLQGCLTRALTQAAQVELEGKEAYFPAIVLASGNPGFRNNISVFFLSFHRSFLLSPKCEAVNSLEQEYWKTTLGQISLTQTCAPQT